MSIALIGMSTLTARADAAPAPRLTLENVGKGALVGAATWRVTGPVSVRMGYSGIDPNRPTESVSGHYAAVMIEDPHGKLVGGTLFFGAHDKLGNAHPEGIGAHPDLKLSAGVYRMLYFTDAPARVSFALLGKSARSATVRTWGKVTDYKVSWQAFGPLGNGAVTFQQDVPLALRKSTVVHFWIYNTGFGPATGQDQLCLLPRAERGTCGTSRDPDFQGGGIGCCGEGYSMLSGLIYGRGFAAGDWDLEFNSVEVSARPDGGVLAVVKN